jgi:hypothetical protein
MLRIYKYYSFAYQTAPAPRSRSISFSSSPGFLSSVDDFYLTSNQLVRVFLLLWFLSLFFMGPFFSDHQMVTETTNNIYNETLYEMIAATQGQGSSAFFLPSLFSFHFFFSCWNVSFRIRHSDDVGKDNGRQLQSCDWS